MRFETNDRLLLITAVLLAVGSPCEWFSLYKKSPETSGLFYSYQIYTPAQTNQMNR